MMMNRMFPMKDNYMGNITIHNYWPFCHWGHGPRKYALDWQHVVKQ